MVFETTSLSEPLKTKMSASVIWLYTYYVKPKKEKCECFTNLVTILTFLKDACVCGVCVIRGFRVFWLKKQFDYLNVTLILVFYIHLNLNKIRLSFRLTLFSFWFFGRFFFLGGGGYYYNFSFLFLNTKFSSVKTKTKQTRMFHGCYLIYK